MAILQAKWVVHLLILAILCMQQTPLWGFLREGSRCAFRRSASSLLSASFFQVGDAVTVVNTTSTTQQQNDLLVGVIEQVRGRGWYTVSLGEKDSQQQRKFRASQLELLARNQTDHREEEVMSALKIPTIINYDKLHNNNTDHNTDKKKQQLDVFHTYSTWIVFSDLHCSAATLSTCLQVLETIHEHAQARKAGIVFLGDFWHVRGTLRVSTLNAVLDALRQWTQPFIAIPGNHDQCSWETNENHALQPFQDAFRLQKNNTNVGGVWLISTPSVFQNAMFIPHVKDPTVLSTLLRSATQQDVVLCHVDCFGASRNDRAVSAGGVQVTDFPVLAYSGHYHEPQVLQSESGGGKRLEYVGSPYQVSLSEAHQQKHLLVLDSANSWECIEKIPITVGRKHYIVHSLSELQTLSVQAGDRVIADLTPREEAQPFLDEMRDKGVTVEVRKTTRSLAHDSAALSFPTEELSPLSIWKRFLDMRNCTKELETMGIELMAEVEALSTTDTTRRVSTGNRLDIDSVSLEGFGPFSSKPITYPLRNRGFVLLKGSNRDDDGCDSNGSGKTSLAMSVLWAMTGSIDPRPMQDSKVADIVNDHSKVARVTLRGTLNGKEFVLCRTKTSTKGRLTFTLDGTDLTAQSIRETQGLWNEALGIPSEVVARTLFHGQHAMHELLEASDVKFKEELSLVVPLDIWIDAAALARKKAREASTRVSELEGMITLRTEDVNALDEKLKELSIIADTKQDEYTLAVKSLQAAVVHAAEQCNGQTPVDLENEMESIEMKISYLDTKRADLLIVEERALTELSAKQSNAEDTIEQHRNTMKEKEQLVAKHSVGSSLAKQKVERLESMWGLDLSSNAAESIDIPDSCPVCQQPLLAHPTIQKSIEEEVVEAIRYCVESSSHLEDAKHNLESISAIVSSDESILAAMKQEEQTIRMEHKEQVSSIEKEIASGRESLRRLTLALSSRAKQIEQVAGFQDLESDLVRKKAGLEQAQNQLAQLEEDKDKYSRWIEEATSTKETQLQSVDGMKELSELFGARGVQTFVLQNALNVLESAAQIYLTHLSEGTQRLELVMGEKIERRVFLRNANGTFTERPLGALSGGQWRRCSLALQLGFVDLVATRLRCSLSVWDEPLTHLDETGRTHVGSLFRQLLTGHRFSTILIILQDLAANELGESFDQIDQVRREKDRSDVCVGEDAR